MDSIGGSGTKQDPYKIENIKQFRVVRQNLDAYYKLVSDIDATYTEEEFEPIGGKIKPFTGTFDGNNYEIRNLCIKQPEEENVGLFGCISEEGHIKNIGLTNATISGRLCVGSLVGRNYGKIESLYVQRGHVSGEKYVGGLIGRSCNNTVVSSHIHGGTVLGEKYVGGIIGINRGKVESSYTVKVDVSGEEYVGGIVGYNWVYVEFSYTVDNNLSGDRQTGDISGIKNHHLESCFTVSNSDASSIPEPPDLMIPRKDHRISYNLETNTLFVHVNDLRVEP